LSLETLTIADGMSYPEVDGGETISLSGVPREELERLVARESDVTGVPRYSSRMIAPSYALWPGWRLGAITKNPGYIIPIVYAIRRAIAECCRNACENANGPGVGGRIGYFENWPITVVSCGDGAASYKVSQRGFILREIDIAAQLKREAELEEELRAEAEGSKIWTK